MINRNIFRFGCHAGEYVSTFVFGKFGKALRHIIIINATHIWTIVKCLFFDTGRRVGIFWLIFFFFLLPLIYEGFEYTRWVSSGLLRGRITNNKKKSIIIIRTMIQNIYYLKIIVFKLKIKLKRGKWTTVFINETRFMC